jgi:hypothetical protein
VRDKSGKEHLIQIPDQFRCFGGVPRYVTQALVANRVIEPCSSGDIPAHLVGLLVTMLNEAVVNDVKDLGVLRMPPGIPFKCVLGVVDFSVVADILDLEQSNPFGDLRLNKLLPLSLPVSMLKRFVWHGLPVFKLGTAMVNAGNGGLRSQDTFHAHVQHQNDRPIEY